MNIGNGTFRLRKSIVDAGRLVVVLAILAAALPEIPLEAASAHPQRSLTPVGAMATQASNPTVTQIAAGEGHTCALTPQGGVVCWGANWSGQLGDGTTTDSAAPVLVNELQSGVMGISLGGYRTCALTTHGRVYCWGNGTPGSPSSSTPVEFNGLGSQVVQVAVGANHTCALTSSGSVLCWGFNNQGQLGDGTYMDRSTPVTAIASGANQVAINDNYTSCAVMTSGGVNCWGQGDRGQLGNGNYGSTYNSNVPVDVLKTGGSPLVGATQVVLGIVFGCAQVSEGVYCWGRNRFGQLGIGGTTDMNTHPYASPVLTALGGPSLSGVDQLMAGDEHACVHRTNGNMQCWGQNYYGQLGIGGAVNYQHESTVPVTVLNTAGTAPLTGVTWMAGGASHTCVFTSWEEASPFLCWGYNAFGQLGNGSTYDGIALPTPVSDFSNFSPALGGGGGTTIGAGGQHTCSIAAGGGVSCWGNNEYGQLGNGSTSDSLEPVNVAGLSSEVKSLALGKDHTCAILSSGQLMCWGRNQHGQLGNGTINDSLVPTYVTLPDIAVTQVAMGDNHTCALAEDGSVLCWGANGYGQLGDGTTNQNPSPVTVIPSGVGGIALGGSTSCAVLTAGGVKCWGWGNVGQLGDGNSGTGYYQSTPTDTLVSAGNPLNGVSQITMGNYFACALKDDRVYCWGRNLSGQLGNGAASTFEVYASLVLSSVGSSPLEGVNQITAGDAHACAHQYTDRLKCWGDNTNRQLGDGSSAPYSATPHPVLDPAQSSQAYDLLELGSEEVPYLEDAAQVSAEGNHTCAFFGWDSLNPYRCWGNNKHGQLGDGTT